MTVVTSIPADDHVTTPALHDMRSAAVAVVAIADLLSRHRGALTTEQVDELLAQIHDRGVLLRQHVDDLVATLVATRAIQPAGVWCGDGLDG